MPSFSKMRKVSAVGPPLKKALVPAEATSTSFFPAKAKASLKRYSAMTDRQPATGSTSLLTGYRPGGGYDECVQADGRPRPQWATVLHALDALGLALG